MSCDSKENGFIKEGRNPLFWGTMAAILSVAWLVGSGGVSFVPTIAASVALISLIVAWGIRSFSFHHSLLRRLNILQAVILAENRKILLIDRQHNILLRSPDADLFGDADDILAPIKIHRHSDSELIEKCAALQAAKDAGIAHHTEISLIAANGHYEWFQISVVMVKGAILWSYEDITARRAIEETLCHEYAKLSDLVDFLPAGFVLSDSDGRIIYINQRLAEWLGDGTRQLTGRNIAEFLSPLPMPDEERSEARLIRRKGEVFNVTVHQNVLDEGGATYIHSLIMREHLQPRNDENAPRKDIGREETSWFDEVPVGIAQLDLNQEVVVVNATFHQMLGLDPSQIIGQPLRSFVIEEDRTAVFGQIARLLLREVPQIKMDLRLYGDQERFVRAHISPIREADHVVGLVLYVLDATERKNLEQQFAQSQKIQAMGQLAGGIAHDFNNLLTAMIGFCDLLLQRHGTGDPSFADIMQIKQNANRAASLVLQLLAFSRRQTLQPRLLDVTDALVELRALLCRLLGENIELVMSHERDMGLVRVDPGQFDQVIINLAVNARDAMVGGGTLTIKSRMSVLDQPIMIGSETMPRGTYVLIEVSDTGVGILKENLERIFEPFFSTKSLGEGTGLGLSTVYGIVRQTEGFIFVDSAPGKGASFMIYLPSFNAEEKAEETTNDRERSSREDSARPQSLTGTGTILLVEDEEAVRMFGARALRNNGYKVLEAASGEQALEVLRDTKNIDVLISDIMMPGMDGITLVRLVRVEYPEIRVILISGYSENMARSSETLEDDIYFLSKPFSLRQLAEKVSIAMSGRKKQKKEAIS